jgi:hypothetical protein
MIPVKSIIAGILIALCGLAAVMAQAAVGENRVGDDHAGWAEAMQAASAVVARGGGTGEIAAAHAAVKARYPDLLASWEGLSGLSLTNPAAGTAPPGRTAVRQLLAAMDAAEAEPFARRLAAIPAGDEAASVRLFADAYDRLGARSTEQLPRLAFIRRRSHGLRGTNGTMFSQRTDKGSAILVYDPARPDQPPQVIFDTQEGFIWDLSPAWDGRTLLMSYKEDNDQPFHVWEINADGTGLRQVTRGPYHDFNPVYYPDGRIIFCSSRVESYSLCQDFMAAALHSCDADGSNLRRFDFTTLCTTAPAVMPDGSILCTRWEYQDKNIFAWQGLWTIHPDGRQLQLYYGNTITIPNSRYGGKSVPGTEQILITMAGHHLTPIGDVAMVDRRRGLENPAGMRKVTFETTYRITQGRNWRDCNWGPGDAFFPCSVTDPWPLADDLFLAAIGNSAQPAAGFRICLCRYSGLRFPVWAREGESYFCPVPLQPREPPRSVIVGQAPQAPGEGTFFVQDLYQGLLQQGVPRGQVKTLRICRQTPKKWNTEGPRFHDHYPIVGYGSYYIKENLGEVAVDENGSACFRAPSNCELYFIALDKDGKEIQRMGSVTQITTGERVACVGCHNNRLHAPPVSLRLAERGAQPPDAITPPPWGAGPFDYVKHVQPVWDRYCVACHAGRTPAAGMDLSGDKTRFFNMSYDALIARNMVAYYFINPGPTGVFPARDSGSWVSRLSASIETNHHDVVVAPDSRRRVYAWIDSNVQYYPTWDMSRPHTMGGRDPWHFVPENRRVMPQPEPWLTELEHVYNRDCVACHATLSESDHGAWSDMRPQNMWINLTRPEFSRLLNAHLSKAAGGLGVDAPKDGRRPPVFQNTNDPVYQAILRAIDKGRAALEARPRMDMPGGQAVPQERDFGRVL